MSEPSKHAAAEAAAAILSPHYEQYGAGYSEDLKTATKYVQDAIAAARAEDAKTIEQLRQEIAALKDEQCTDIGIIEGLTEQVADLRAFKANGLKLTTQASVEHVAGKP